MGAVGSGRGPAALCADLSLDEAAHLFFPESKGGLMQRTSRWPAPDSHATARELCAACPLLEPCLGEAMREDGWTFRGLSPEERAALGGVRSGPARKRPVYITIGEVIDRILDTPYPAAAIYGALSTHDQDMQQMEHKDRVALGVWEPNVGWSNIPAIREAFTTEDKR